MRRSLDEMLEDWFEKIQSQIRSELILLSQEEFDKQSSYSIPGTDEEYTSNAYPALTIKEKELCKMLLESNFEKMLNDSYSRKPDWDALDVLFHHCKEYLEEIYRTHSQFPIYAVVNQKSGHLFKQWRQSFVEQFSQVLSDFENADVDDLICFTDSEIMGFGRALSQRKSRLELLKFFESLKRKLTEYEKKYIAARYLDFSGTPRIKERNTKDLFSWIEDSILVATPSIEFLSRAQVEMLRKKIEVIALAMNSSPNPKYLNNRFDYLISAKSTTLGRIDFEPFLEKEEIKNNIHPSVVIRYLFYGIQGFNPKYINDPRDLKMWLCCLFRDIEGFSYDSIRKALERNKDKYEEANPSRNKK